MLFPTATFYVFSEDSRHHRLMDSDGQLPTAEEGYEQALEDYGRIFQSIETVYGDSPIPDDWDYKLRRLTIRYRLHRTYRQLLPDFPGQRFHVLRALTTERDVIESDLWSHGSEVDERSFLTECVSSAASGASTRS